MNNSGDCQHSGRIARCGLRATNDSVFVISLSLKGIYTKYPAKIIVLNASYLLICQSMDKDQKICQTPEHTTQEMRTLSDRKPDPKIQISPAILPEGYSGKILLVSVAGAMIEKTVILRSGDLWHREILRNTENEIRGLGVVNPQVHPLGGALLRFEPGGTIIIYGSSHEFGVCDKEYAAVLVRDAFPGRQVAVRD
jgi:hypothetical protein